MQKEEIASSPFALRTVRYRAANAELVESPQGLEVYSSGGAEDGPLVVYFHGGSWGQGARGGMWYRVWTSNGGPWTLVYEVDDFSVHFHITLLIQI